MADSWSFMLNLYGTCVCKDFIYLSLRVSVIVVMLVSILSDLVNVCDIKIMTIWMKMVFLSISLLLFISFVAIFWWFLSSNTPIMLYNIRYWQFFLSQGNRWTKYLAHPKIWRSKLCLLMFVSLFTLDGFHILLFTQLTANVTQEWSGGSMFHWLSHAKTPFCCIETVANNALNCWCIVVFDQLWANSPSLWTQLSH